MTKIPGGYILKARKTLESEIMDKPPLFSKLWDWMLLVANHKSGYKGLKRGQFFTTINDMREAMSWKVGYRKHTPSKGDIRSAYETFTKRTMISIAKSTRGMVVTILKYDEYQNPKNYEQHTEQHTETPTNNTVTTQDKQERKECKNDNLKKGDEFEFKIAVCIPKNIFLTDKMQAYVLKQGANGNYASELFEDFKNWYGAKGKKNQDWTKTFFTWVRKDKRDYHPDKYMVKDYEK